MKINVRYLIIKHTTATVVLLVILAWGETAVQAQLGGLFGNKTPAADSGVVVDKDAFGKSVDDVMGKVLTARLTFLNAKAKLMEALGLKTTSVIKASEALQAVQGATSDSDKVAALNDSTQTTKEADQQLNDSLTQSTELSADSKAKFAEGTGKFIEGVLLEKDQIETIQNLVQQGQSLAQSASVFDKLKVTRLVKPVITLSSMVPGDVKEGTTTLGKIMQFAKKENITDIPNADKATAGLGSLD